MNTSSTPARTWPSVAHRVRLVLMALVTAASLCACALPDKPLPARVYDLGLERASPAASAMPSLPLLLLADLEAPLALEGSAVRYRLEYAQAQQSQAYAQARWSMPPAQLLQQRLRERLARTRTVLTPTQAIRVEGPDGTQPWKLSVELDEFTQVFSSEQTSVGVLRLRATLTQGSARGVRLLGQHSVAVQRPCPSPDAQGAVVALASASDAAIDELLQWLSTQRP